MKKTYFSTVFIFSFFLFSPFVNASPIVEDSGEILRFVLIDAGTNKELFELEDNSVINLNTIGTRQINIRAYTKPEKTGSVLFELAGPKKRQHIENISPYALFANEENNFNKWRPAVGEYTLSATPYSEPEGKGEAGKPYAISFSIKDGVEVTGFYLVDADSDKELFEITEGMEIDIKELASQNINIRAKTATDEVGSVEFSVKDLKEDHFYGHTENAQPFAVFSDHKGDYYGRIAGNGSFLITATPYTRPNARGDKGYALKRKFSMKNATEVAHDNGRLANARFMESDISLNSFTVFPNPGRNVLNLYFDDFIYGDVQINVFDLMGNEVLSKNKKVGKGNVNIMIDVSELSSKPYIIKLTSGEGTTHSLRWHKE